MLLLNRIAKGGTPVSAEGDNEKIVQSGSILTDAKLWGKEKKTHPL